MAVKRAKTSRRSNSATEQSVRTAKTAATTKASAKKAPVKKTAVKKAPAKAAKKAPAKSAKKPVIQKGPAKNPAAKRPAAKTAAKKSASKASKPAKQAADGVVQVVERALDDMKAVNVSVLDVRKLTDITDTMIIATGNSDRHVRSIADRVVEFAKKAGFRPVGVEGERDGEWVLVDLHEVIVHIMLPRVREFYRLENLWDVSAARRDAAAASS
jgi:ribosome-associated protein